LRLYAVPKLAEAVRGVQQRCTASYLQMMMDYSSSSSSSSSDDCADASTSDDGSSSSRDAVLFLQSIGQPQLGQHACLDEHLDALVSTFAGFCYDVAFAVPLPEVCNNPGCERLNGLSEAGAAVKACAGCGARYCSQDCQKLAWPKHRAACRWLRSSSGAGWR
jgi:hypothetical protein